MPTADPGAEPAPERGGAYTYSGAIHWEYSPELDHEPDPGEVVWTWVAFEEDASVGKDRPVAVVGRAEDRSLVALMLSSRSHHGDRDWMSIGSGPWDREGDSSAGHLRRHRAQHGRFFAATAIGRDWSAAPSVGSLRELRSGQGSSVMSPSR